MKRINHRQTFITYRQLMREANSMASQLYKRAKATAERTGLPLEHNFAYYQSRAFKTVWKQHNVVASLSGQEARHNEQIEAARAERNNPGRFYQSLGRWTGD